MDNLMLFENIVKIERKLSLLEVLFEKDNFIARNNTDGDSKEFNKQREYQLLIELSAMENKMINEVYRYINDIKSELRKEINNSNDDEVNVREKLDGFIDYDVYYNIIEQNSPRVIKSIPIDKL